MSPSNIRTRRVLLFSYLLDQESSFGIWVWFWQLKRPWGWIFDHLRFLPYDKGPWSITSTWRENYFFLGNDYLFTLCTTWIPYIWWRSGQNAAKWDLSGLETRLLKKRKLVPNKEIPNVSESQPLTLSPLKSFHPSSPKKMKTLMSNEVCRSDWEISSLLCETDGSGQTRSSNEFKFWSNSFDGLEFCYDHLNVMEEVNKV